MTISIEEQLVERIDALAQAEDRSRSNWIVKELKQVVEHREREARGKPYELPAAVHVDVTPLDSTASSRVAEEPTDQSSTGHRVRSTRGGVGKLVDQRKGKSPS